MLKGLSVGALWGGILAAVVALVLSLATPVPGSRLAEEPSMPPATALPTRDMPAQPQTGDPGLEPNTAEVLADITRQVPDLAADATEPPQGRSTGADLGQPAAEPPQAADLAAGLGPDPVQGAETDTVSRAPNAAAEVTAAPGAPPEGISTVAGLAQPAAEQPLPVLRPAPDPRPEPAPPVIETSPSLPPAAPPGPLARTGTPAQTVLDPTGLPELASEQTGLAPGRPTAPAPPDEVSSPAPPVAQALPAAPLPSPTEPISPRIAAIDAPVPSLVTDVVPDLVPIEQAPDIAADGQTAPMSVAEGEPEFASRDTLPPSLPEIAALGSGLAAPEAVAAPDLPSIPDPAHARAAQAASPAPLADDAPQAARVEPQAPAFPIPTDPSQRIAALDQPGSPSITVPALHGLDTAPVTAEAQGLDPVDIATEPPVAPDIAAPPETGREIILSQAPSEQAPPAEIAHQDSAAQTAPPAQLAIAPPSPGQGAADGARPAPAEAGRDSAPGLPGQLGARSALSGGGLGLPQVSRFGVTVQPGAGEAAAPVAETTPEVEDRPALLAHAATFDQGETRPLLAIMLLVAPDAPVDPDLIAALPMPVTVALVSEDAGQAGALRAAGLELALRLGDLSGAALDAALAALPETVALLDDAAGTLQSDRDALDRVLARIGQTGHGLVTYPRGFNMAERTAAQQGLAATTLFRDLAGLPEAEMRRVLDRAAFAAGLEGTAVVAAPLEPDVVAVLVGWALADRSDAVALAPVSAVLQQRQSSRPD